MGMSLPSVFSSLFFLSRTRLGCDIDSWSWGAGGRWLAFPGLGVGRGRRGGYCFSCIGLCEGNSNKDLLWQRDGPW